MKSKRIFTKSSNKKGLWCPFKPILCQEGYCQECQINPDVAVIMMTGYASIDIVVNVVNEGAYAYLSKSINTRELPEMIAEMLLRQRKDNPSTNGNG